METSYIILTILAVIVVAIFIFALMKGVIRMILLALAVSGSVAAWMFLQKNGFTYLAFITDSPKPWMSSPTACAGSVTTI